MLRGKLVLHDVPDVEVLCVKVVRSYERTTQADFPPADREDLVAYLIAAAWELSIRFDAGRGVPFESILRLQLPFRVVDFIRKNNGRTSWRFSSHEYTREAVRNLSLDAPGGTDADGDSRQLGDVVAAPASVPETDSASYRLERLDYERRRCRARDRRILSEWLNSPLQSRAA
jgi:hypothetical protein